MRRRPEIRRRPDMTESPSTGSGGQSSVLCPDGLPVYREILCPHNTVIQSSCLSIHIFQQTGRTGLRQAGRIGDSGAGICSAIFRISSCAFLSCSSRVATFTRSAWAWSSNWVTFAWCSLAQSSTLPWKFVRCWLRAALASARNASESFTRAIWVAW